MEEGSLKENFKQGLETLGDLYALGDSRLYPLFDRLHFHLNEINALKEKSKRVGEYRSLRRLFINNLNENILNFFRDYHRPITIDLVDTMVDPKLESLDHMSSVFPLAGEVCKLFSFQKNIKIVLKNNSFSFQGKVPFDLNLEHLREETYRLTRLFLKNNVLFTFKVLESLNKDLFELEFDFHFDDSDVAPHLIQINKSQVLKLSGVIKSFKRPMHDLEKVGEHNVFLLTEDLEVKKLDRIAFLDCYNDKNYELFHFPFLFRPISLIIKRSIYGGKESINESRLMPLQSGKSLEVLNIDLFEIFQK